MRLWAVNFPNNPFLEVCITIPKHAGCITKFIRSPYIQNNGALIACCLILLVILQLPSKEDKKNTDVLST